MYEEFLRRSAPAPGETIADVGATSDQTYEASNYLEAWHPDKAAITAIGIDDASHLENLYPGCRFVQANGLSLPFADESFDHVHSSAVVEHVGSREAQHQFVSELYRVARRSVFITTPNRWYPVEFHTVLPLVHWLPHPLFSRVCHLTGRAELGDMNTLNLLDRQILEKIACAVAPCRHEVLALKLFGWPSNLLLVMKKG